MNTIKNMKKLVISSILIFSVISNLWAIDEKYTRGYIMEPSVVNTTDNETAMSFLKDKVVYSVIDAQGNIKIYSAVIDEANIELKEPPVEMPEMQKLGIYGTFGFDESTGHIYFSRYDKGTKNYMLYTSTMKDENKWSKPKRMKIQGLRGFINTGSATVNAGWLYRNPGFSGFFNPTLAQDGRVYFSGDFSSGHGDRDIWYVHPLGGNKWSMPQNVGTIANTDAREDYPFVSGDSLLYFASKKAHGDFDLYVSKKEGGQWQQATALDPIYNTSSDDYNLIGTDKVLYFISGRNAAKGDDIYRPMRINIGEMLVLTEPRPLPEPDAVFRTFPWKLFYFDFDKDVLNPEFLAELDELYVVMQDYKLDFDFVIKGHTDERGSVPYNERLSYRRAQRIYRLLIERGMPAGKMRIEAFGKSQPEVPNAVTEEEHARNRRVEVDIVRTAQEQAERATMENSNTAPDVFVTE